MTEIIAYLGALFIGILLGLLGGGGSILAVPIFVYFLGFSPVIATAYSLFVVGSTSSIGAIRSYISGKIDLRRGLLFAFPALIAVYITRKYIVPAIPENIFQIRDFILTKDIFIMVLFASIMLLAAISMIRPRKKPPLEKDAETPSKLNVPVVLLEGTVLGLVTGLVGAGGGFLIVPALVLFGGLTMKKAVGTSLLIVSIKSLIGFIGDIENIEIDWGFLIPFTAIAIAGILLGIYLSRFISNKNLKIAFGWFVLIMAIYILVKEILNF